MSVTKVYKLEVQLHEFNLTTGAGHAIRTFTAELGQSKEAAITLFHKLYETTNQIPEKGEPENP